MCIDNYLQADPRGCHRYAGRTIGDNILDFASGTQAHFENIMFLLITFTHPHFVFPPPISSKYQTASTAAAASIAAATGGVPAPAEAAASTMWEQVKVPFEDTIYDIDFDR